MSGTTIELDETNVVDYLKDRGALPRDAAAVATTLGWGISNFVARISWERDCLVVKQSLPKLRVEEEWSFDRERIAVEERCMRYLGELLPPACVPSVRFSDQDNHVFAMSCAPPGGVLWKESLLSGHVDLAAAEWAGGLLARVHVSAAEDPRVPEMFGSQSGLIEGRISPYHLTAAMRNPEIADLIDDEVRRLLATTQTLVLGDYCPKNTFVYPDRVLILDFEVAHYGDPAFDVAFCINHLVLKACHFPDQASTYLDAARGFWRTYRAAAESRFEGVEQASVRELGCLLIARIDGKSKIEYITDERTRSFVRELGREILIDGRANVEDALSQIELAIGHTYTRTT